MKNVNNAEKLSLKKITISKLDNLIKIKGGGSFSDTLEPTMPPTNNNKK